MWMSISYGDTDGSFVRPPFPAVDLIWAPIHGGGGLGRGLSGQGEEELSDTASLLCTPRGARDRTTCQRCERTTQFAVRNTHKSTSFSGGK